MCSEFPSLWIEAFGVVFFIKMDAKRDPKYNNFTFSIFEPQEGQNEAIGEPMAPQMAPNRSQIIQKIVPQDPQMGARWTKMSARMKRKEVPKLKSYNFSI